MPFQFRHEHPPSSPLDGPQSPDEDLDTFSRVLLGLEQFAAEGATPEELYHCVKIVQCGSTIVCPRFDPGVTVYRARAVSRKPAYKSEINYPPSSYVKSNGRCNGVGETIFYGSVAYPHAGGALYECRAKPGDVFAVGTWVTTKPLVVNHMGYSSAEINARVPERPTTNWMIHDEDDTRNAVLRSWVSKVFTKVVAPGDEHLYSLSIALTRFGLEATRGGPADVADGFGGIMYPSTCTNLMGHNVALRPSFVDTGMDLKRVDLVRVVSIDQPADHITVNPLDVKVSNIDFALCHQADGRLIWAGENTYLSATLFS